MTWRARAASPTAISVTAGDQADLGGRGLDLDHGDLGVGADLDDQAGGGQRAGRGGVDVDDDRLVHDRARGDAHQERGRARRRC